jgi:hypothetical protein
MLNPEGAVVSVQTSPGDEASHVEELLKSEIWNYPLKRFLFFVDLDHDPEYVENWRLSDTVTLPGWEGEFIIGGTETGLGIQPPVGSVSARYDFSKNVHELLWHEKGDYDKVVTNYGRESKRLPEGPQSSNRFAASFLIPGRSHFKEELDCHYVVAFRNGLPANVSCVWYTWHDQVEYFYHPFTNGMATNWTGWSNPYVSRTTFEEKAFSDSWKAPVTKRKGSQFRCAQVIRNEANNSAGGMYRFFLGQNPGRRYRPALRFQALPEAEDYEGDWSFDVLMGTVGAELAYNLDQPTQVVQADQWTLLKQSGNQLNEWHFDQNTELEAEWTMLQTESDEGDSTYKDFAIGEDESVIFMCVRLSGYKPAGIAMDGVRVVDVTDGFLNEQMRKKWL